MSLFTQAGICTKCRAHVRNVPGKRKTRDELERVHADSCAGLHRGKGK